MSRPTLSVAMPNYNHAEFLPRAIEGILKQTRPPDEFLILDDASTDNSVEIIESYARQNASIRFIRGEKNLGVIAAHETLYRQAQGDYLYSAAADDDRYPDFFKLAMDQVAQHPEAGLVFGKMVITDGYGTEQAEIGVQRWQSALYASPKQFLTDFLECEPAMQAMTGATIFRRTAFESVGWCRPELGSFADTFATRAIAMKFGACYVPERFYIWHRMPGSYSDQTNQDAKRGIDIIARTVRLMKSPEFADRFPRSYVERWARRQKSQILWNHLLAAGAGDSSARRPFWLRNLARLPRLLTIGALLTYRGSAE